MNLLLDLEILGWLLAGVGVLQVVPAGAALIYGEPSLPYAGSALAALVYGVSLGLSARPRDRRMRSRDGFIVVSAAWFLASLFGALPYVLSGVLDPVDAFFESVAGFTTTGSTVMAAIEDAPRGLLLWRAMTQWLGGMGIIVFTIAVLPLLGIGGMQLFRAEVPGPVTDKLTPRIATTARRLWFVYVGFTLAALVALLVAGMGFFDALCHALTTLATGGFSTRGGSIGAWNSAAIEWVVIFFMGLAGTNFALHYRLLTGNLARVARDSELRLYLAVMAGFVAVVSWVLLADSDAPALRRAAFQVVSLLTTTGYGTDDYELWPALGQFLVLPLLILGGMAGSTSGGFKTLRWVLGLRTLRAYLARLARPFSVQPVRFGGRSVPDDVVSGVVIFFMAYAALAFFAAGAVAASGYDFVTAASAALTALGNVGPGLGEVGPRDHFAHFPASVKLTLCFCMIAGRLEVFTLLVLLDPRFWRR